MYNIGLNMLWVIALGPDCRGMPAVSEVTEAMRRLGVSSTTMSVRNSGVCAVDWGDQHRATLIVHQAPAG